MAEDYTETSRNEAERIAATLKQLDVILASDKMSALNVGDVTELRRSVRKMLIGFNTDLEGLANIERDDIFKTNPVFATQRHQLIKNIETAKIDFEFDIVPTLEKLTKQVVQHFKRNPPATVDESALPPAPPGTRWTVQKVLDAAEQFVDQAIKAVGVASKAYPLVKALGLLVGIPLRIESPNM